MICQIISGSADFYINAETQGEVPLSLLSQISVSIMKRRLNLEKAEKIKLITFFAVAFGVTALMAIPMYYGIQHDMDLNTLTITQMMYPACGVILGNLFTSKKTGSRYPVMAYSFTLIFTVILILLSLVSVFVPLKPINVGDTEYSVIYLAASVLMMPFSVAVFCMFIMSAKYRKENAGVCFKNMLISILLLILFLVIYIGRIFLEFGISEMIDHDGREQMNEFLNGLKSVTGIIMLVSTVISLPLAWLPYFGEEYGWRHFLQPRLQQKFGLRKGIIILGVIWGLWHAPLCFMYYSRETGLQMQTAQIITCIAYAIFFGFVYMKTENIWLPVVIHYLNNNLIPVIAGDASPEVLENQTVSWSDIPLHALLMIFYLLFIFAKEFRTPQKSEKNVTENKQAE